MTDISRSQAWLESLRPKTLPLAFAAIIVGTVLAWEQGHFDPWVALLALITAGLLQILSNLANDYGDAVKGSDKPDRIGPLRGMQKGVITPADEARPDRHRRTHLPVWFGAAVRRLAERRRFHRLPRPGRPVYRGRHHLHGGHPSVWIYWSG